MKTTKHLGQLIAIVAFFFVFGSNKVQAQDKTITYYTYCKVYDAASKTHYYTHIFSFKVDEYRAGDGASLATGRLESRFYSYIYNATASRYLVKSTAYYSTRTEAEQERDRNMNLNISGGEKTAIANYFSWRFNKND